MRTKARAVGRNGTIAFVKITARCMEMSPEMNWSSGPRELYDVVIIYVFASALCGDTVYFQVSCVV